MPVVYEHTLDISLYGETFRSITNPTCIWALFTKTTTCTLIQQLCTFHLVPHQLTPSIRFLDASIILFTKVTNITRTCVGRNTVQLQPCIQCVYRLPCPCSFHTEIGYVAPSLEFCGPITNNRTQRPVSHVTNLAILKYFFDQEALGTLTADTMLRDPIETSLPEFNVYDHKNYSKQLAIIDDTKFQLDRAVNLSIRRQTAYRSMAELLTHQQQNDVSDTGIFASIDVPQEYQSILLYASIILSIVAMALCVILQSCIKYSTNKYQYQYQYQWSKYQYKYQYLTFKYQYQYKYCA